MYNPPRFKSKNDEEAFTLMDRFPFATVISTSEGAPLISHLPLTPVKVGTQIELIGHLARANPHWKVLGTSSATAIFHGSHTYITPKWYAENDVPTWNYSVVHAKGRSELIESQDGIIECLQELRTQVERHWPSGWKFFIPNDLAGELSKHIVGFRIKVSEINYKKKLSQNRSPKDRAGILRGLETRTDENSYSVLKEMLSLYRQDGETK